MGRHGNKLICVSLGMLIIVKADPEIGAETRAWILAEHRVNSSRSSQTPTSYLEEHKGELHNLGKSYARS